MSRLDRYQLAVLLAQEILTGNPSKDDFRIEQAFGDIRDEVYAGRRNQREMNEVNRHAARLLNDMGYSVAVPPRLELVKGDDAS